MKNVKYISASAGSGKTYSLTLALTNAIKNKEVYKMPLGMYRSYTCGVDTPVTLLWLAKTAYPSLFEDIDITAETKKYYSEVFGITLTDEQANKIFSPVTAAGTGFVGNGK